MWIFTLIGFLGTVLSAIGLIIKFFFGVFKIAFKILFLPFILVSKIFNNRMNERNF